MLCWFKCGQFFIIIWLVKKLWNNLITVTFIIIIIMCIQYFTLIYVICTLISRSHNFFSSLSFKLFLRCYWWSWYSRGKNRCCWLFALTFASPAWVLLLYLNHKTWVVPMRLSQSLLCRLNWLIQYQGWQIWEGLSSW